MESESLHYLIRHIFLPLRLPQETDQNDARDHLLIEEAYYALQKFTDISYSGTQPSLTRCVSMLYCMLASRTPSGIHPETLEAQLRSMINKDVIVLNIRAQNAALIIRNELDHYTFEAFELSPTNQAVTSTKGRLRRCFPGPAVEVDLKYLQNPTFRQPFCEMIVKLDAEAPLAARPTSTKAHTISPEIRESNSPQFVTELVMGILRGIGKPAKITRIYKHTRDDVLWRDCLEPWRRSPLWLCIRCALQTTMMRQAGPINGYILFKSFMIYFMSRILERALGSSVSSDVIFCMRSKIVRRLLKLNPPTELSWIAYVRGVVAQASNTLQQRWLLIERNPDPFSTQKEWMRCPDSFLRDCNLSLPKLRLFLKEMKQRKPLASQHNTVTPSPVRCTSMNAINLPSVEISNRLVNDEQKRRWLADVEEWISSSLPSWQATNATQANACINLAKLIQQYTKLALCIREDEPEALSIMILSAMELWVAMDKVATYHQPILLDYGPAIPIKLFSPLLLPRRTQLERLSVVESHLNMRHRQSNNGYPSAMYGLGPNCLAERFFDVSSSHKELRRRIETDATNKRVEKRAELRREVERYANLVRQADSISCSWTTQDVLDRHSGQMMPTSLHDPKCEKCQLKSIAQSIDIDCHEWPLPSKDIEAKIVVFELDVPPIISRWRDTTYYLLADVFTSGFLKPSSTKLKSNQRYSLFLYAPLQSYTTNRSTQRLQLISTTKPFTASHYSSKHASSATEANICVSNGLRFQLYDHDRYELAQNALGMVDLQDICTMKLPEGPYTNLQYTVEGTNHTSNSVVARQSECRRNITVHEYLAFGHLRAGHRLQWQNIARNLVNGELTFNRDEVSILIAQAIWQAGPDSSTLPSIAKDSHACLENALFCMDILKALEQALFSIEKNWQGATALRTFSMLVARILSMSSDNQVHLMCFKLLRHARQTSLQWTRELSRKLCDSENGNEINSWRKLVLETGITCTLTFDVDSDYLPELLGSDDNLAILIESSIIVYNVSSPSTSETSEATKSLLNRSSALLHRMETTLMQQILVNQRCLEHALQRIWASYRPGSCWTREASPLGEWIVTEMSQLATDPLTVHYNVLTGSLLLNGLPLARLPQPYESHPSYRRLFGNRGLSVVPATVKGMRFSTRDELFGYQTSFPPLALAGFAPEGGNAIQHPDPPIRPIGYTSLPSVANLFCKFHFVLEEEQLIIRASKGAELYEVLPEHAFKGDLPPAFLHQYFFWLDLKTNDIELRPLKNPWSISTKNWTLRTTKVLKVLTRNAVKLVDPQSPTAKSITALLSPLEKANRIHITFNTGENPNRLEVHLPRLKLEFFVNALKQVESKQFLGMVVDSTQSCGVFTGLQNKLLLQNRTTQSRTILVPHGEVHFCKEGHHHSVHIETGDAQHVTFHVYEIDPLLGRLVDTGDFTSRLFRILLHAVTANVLPDSLTGRTGTEQALYSLSEEYTLSVRSFTAEDVKILESIAQLTPRREYYPSHLRGMQTVRWRDLSSLAQHESFSSVVQLISERVKKLQLFHGSSALPETSKHGNFDLVERAVSRNATFRALGYGAEHIPLPKDAVYTSRETLHETQELSACETAKLVNEWSTNLTVTGDLLYHFELWGNLDGAHQLKSFTLGYDEEYLGSLDDFFRKHWLSLQSLLVNADPKHDKYRLMIFLSTIAYSEKVDPCLTQTLLAFATISSLRSLKLPEDANYDLTWGYSADKGRLRNAISYCALSLEQCPEYGLAPVRGEKRAQTLARQKKIHKSAKSNRENDIVELIQSQWPRETIDLGNRSFTYHDPRLIYNKVNPMFTVWHTNRRLRDHIKLVQEVLDSLQPPSNSSTIYKYSKSTYAPALISPSRVDWKFLFSHPPPDFEAHQGIEVDYIRSSGAIAEYDKAEGMIFKLYSMSREGYREKYAQDLMRSLQCLQETEEQSFELIMDRKHLQSKLAAEAVRRREDADQFAAKIRSAFQGHDSIAHLIAHDAGEWPDTTPFSLLRHLSTFDKKECLVPGPWKSMLTQYALCIISLQKSERLLACASGESDLVREINNPGHQGWDPFKHPDWVLFEIENNILIRSVQAHIAQEMINPASGQNSIVQLNMGEGKSSVIVPIVAATLADGEKLARVFVLPSLSNQMFHMLRKKLGGMLNRRIYTMPFSRALQLNTSELEYIQKMYVECKNNGGVLLCQPEHILSFELMGMEKSLSSKNSEIGKVVVTTQQWLDQHARDILDESDEILSVKFELVYTIGAQQAIEFSPNRWNLVMYVLSMIKECICNTSLQEQFPTGFQITETQPGQFPRIQILEATAGRVLMEKLAMRISTGELPHLPVWKCSPDARVQLYQYLTDMRLDQSAVPDLYDSLWAEPGKSTLKLLRGLIAHGVMSFIFTDKRWRVNYGLDLSRSLLAVPYRAKDLPALRAEFSHPDAVIGLTCLSYYYGGLSDAELFLCFDKLVSSDTALEEFDFWVQDLTNLPAAFRSLVGINLSDKAQCTEELFPRIRFAKNVIDFYLAKIVFPKEMKEFPGKLSSSGWDIARSKNHPITGFSGTNDSKYILPLSIDQAELPEQLHTNATVLHCILQPINTYEVMTSSEGLEGFLQLISTASPPIRVVLDVGAFVLELRNHEMARNWLNRVSSADTHAVVFFDDRDELVVLSRDDRVEPLLVSPFAKRLDQCLVYLDEAHTRGTDLKLPTSYRAAVTLSLRLTKDRLVQACMRMRKLASGQSVMFCAPTEVHRKIVRHTKKLEDACVTVEDVLLWTISNTHENTKKCAPLWAIQGIRHQKRSVKWTHRAIPHNLIREAAESVVEPEARSLSDRYGLGMPSSCLDISGPLVDDILPSKMKEVQAILAKCEALGVKSLDGSTLQEEQERELSPEIEQERQLERPRRAEAAKHTLHADLISMVKRGSLDWMSPAFIPAFKTLLQTSAAGHFKLEYWPSNLLATHDFAKTVQAVNGKHENDMFLRPVQWILDCAATKTLAIISPYEANELLPGIMRQNNLILRVYSPRTTASMTPLDHINFCSLPSYPLIATDSEINNQLLQLNLFAGQLYFQDYEEYVTLCRFLGLCFRVPTSDISSSNDGFVAPIDRKKFDAVMVKECPFKSSPVAMLRALMGFRRKSHGFEKSQMGAVLGGELILERAFL